VLKMISEELRVCERDFEDNMPVTEAMLHYCVHVYRETKGMLDHDNLGTKRKQTAEHEFIFNLARKLGVSSLRIFSDCWQQFLSCQDLQQLIVTVAPDGRDKDVEATLAPELVKIIGQFYVAQLRHDEDSCLLLTKYFKSSDEQYAGIVETIRQNAKFYHAGALFHLAQLQASNRQCCRNIMDTDVFEIITKAFENLSAQPSQKVLDYIDWVFSTCTSNKRSPAKSPFYMKLINMISKHSRAHPEMLLRVLQHMETHGSLMKHSTAAELGSSLVTGYCEHFLGRVRDCGHAAYATVIAEMQRARLECRHYVTNGETMFDSEVIGAIRKVHSTKKKLMKLLSDNFPEPPKSDSV